MPIMKEKRVTQKCALCSNHGLHVDKKAHTGCIYEKDHACKKCQNTKERRNAGAKEIRRKRKLELTNDKNRQQPLNIRKTQHCRKCRNHGLTITFSGVHKASCLFTNCSCELCKETASLRNTTRIENFSRRHNKNLKKASLAFPKMENDDKILTSSAESEAESCISFDEIWEYSQPGFMLSLNVYLKPLLI